MGVTHSASQPYISCTKLEKSGNYWHFQVALGMGSVWEFGASQSLKKNYLDVPLEDRINGDRISG